MQRKSKVEVPEHDGVPIGKAAIAEGGKDVGIFLLLGMVESNEVVGVAPSEWYFDGCVEWKTPLSRERLTEVAVWMSRSNFVKHADVEAGVSISVFFFPNSIPSSTWDGVDVDVDIAVGVCVGLADVDVDVGGVGDGDGGRAAEIAVEWVPLKVSLRVWEPR